jgi:hypothetical protein
VPDRDRSVEHMLRRVLSARRSASTQSPCVDGETLAAWTSGSLGAALAADVERHVADCARCQAMMAVFVQTEPVAPTTETIWRRWRLGWVVPLATAATAAALWIALPGNSTLPPPPTADTASRSVAVAPESPAAASDQLSAAVPRESAAPPPSAIRERLDAGAGNEARKQLDEAPRREPTEERFAAAAPPPAPAVAAPAESAEADRRELAANASARTFAARATAAPLEIVAPGGVARWRIVNGQQIERTTSAGADWTPVAIDSPEVLTSGAARSSSVCWIVGRRGAVYLTTDGLRFVRLPFPETIDLVSVMAADDRTATVSAADGRSWQTIDRGITWSALR